jgi:hypothetical protein
LLRQRIEIEQCLQDIEYKKYNAPPRRITSESGKLRCRLSISSMTTLQPEPVR